ALFGRFNRAPSSSDSGFAHIERFRLRSRSLTLGITATPSAVIANDLRGNIWSTWADSAWRLNPASGAAPLNPGGLLPAGPADPASYGVAIGGLGALYSGAGGRSHQGQWNIVDTLSVTHGTHLVRAGLDYQRLTP